MASIRKRNLLGIVLFLIFIMVRILLYYLGTQKGLYLTNPYIYCIVDILIVVSILTFVYEDKRIRRVVYVVVAIVVLWNITMMFNEMKNTKRIFLNGADSKIPVVVQIKNEENNSDIYVYEVKYGVFSELKDIIYNKERISFDTNIELKWINDKLLSIVYKNNNMLVQNIAYFGASEKKYLNLLNSIKGTWEASNGDSINVTNDNVEYIKDKNKYIYTIDSSDEQNNFATVLYGNYSKPSITIVKEGNESIRLEKVELGNEKGILMNKIQ